MKQTSTLKTPSRAATPSPGPTGLSPEEFKRSLQAINALGATPAVLVKVIKMAKDPNTDLASFSNLLRNDGALAADIIRISNSSYYAPETPHGNLVEAVNQIGMREVMRVVNLSLAQQIFARDLPSYGVSARDYWSASIATALVMEAVAKRSGLNAEDAYTIGILHAVGCVLINSVIEEKRFTVYWDEQQPIAEWERAAVGFDYAEAGAMLLTHWHFPPTMCEVIRWQLDPEKIVAQISPLGCLQFTQRLLALTGLDFGNEGWEPSETDPFQKASGLSGEACRELVTGCRDDFNRIQQLVDLS